MISGGLEIGKSYMSRIGEEEDRTERIYQRKIVGRVLEGTVEYEDGFRFYDDIGQTYCDKGYASADPEDETPADLVRQIVLEDVKYGSATHHIYDLVKLHERSDFIHHTHPDFFVAMGESYVNRMGIPILISTMLQCSCDDLECPEYTFTDFQDETHYTGDGRYLDLEEVPTPSMYDLIYKKL